MYFTRVGYGIHTTREYDRLVFIQKFYFGDYLFNYAYDENKYVFKYIPIQRV